MVKIIFLIIFVSLICVFVLFGIFLGVYLLTLNFKYKISLIWIEKKFKIKSNWISRLNIKLYECIVILNIISEDIFVKISRNVIKYILSISVVLIIIAVSIEYKHELINLLIKEVKIKNYRIAFYFIKFMILIVGIKVIKRCYAIRIRKNIKESYYKEVIDEYLNQKDIILNVLKLNMYNEKILYNILRCLDNELSEISKSYKKEIFNIYDKESFDREYREIELNIKRLLPQMDELKKYKINYGELNRFRYIYNKKSRKAIIYSIDKKLYTLFYYLELKGHLIDIFDKKYIIKRFMKDNNDISIIIEDTIKIAISERIRFLIKINKVDKRIGLYDKENNVYELLKRIK